MTTYTRKPNELIAARNQIVPTQLISDEDAPRYRELVTKGILPMDDFLMARKRWDGPFNNPVCIERRGPSPDPSRPELGVLKSLRYNFNLRTNDGIDWQNRAMSGGFNTSTLAATGLSETATANVAITAPTTTTAGKVTDTNAAITTSTAALNQFIGCQLLYGATATTPAKAAHIVGNSASGASSVIWYFDQWFSPSDYSATVSAPAANLSYVIVPASTTLYIGLATNSGAQAVTDHTIGNGTTTSAEIGSGVASAPTAAGLGRAFAAAATNFAHTAGTATYQLKNVFTASGTFTAVQQCGMFTANYLPGDAAADLANVGKGGGVMAFENTFSSVNMISGDTLTITWTVSY